MRLVGNIPHDRLAINVFEWNERFIVKLEGGPMEQTFKLEKTTVSGIEEITKLLDEEFINNTVERFNAMHQDLLKGLSRI